MRKITYDFPYPVLFVDNDDYINSSFSIEYLNVTDKDKEFHFEFSYNLSSPGLTDLILKGKARVVLRVECGETSFRTVYSFDTTVNQLQIAIPKNSVAKMMTVKGFIVSNDRLTDFLLREQNSNYFSTPFAVEVGEILAYEPGLRIYLDASELEKPVASIINICINDINSDAVAIDFTGDKIRIYLEEKAYLSYSKLRKNPQQKRYLAGLVVLPAVIEAVYDIMNSWNDDECRLLWYRVIKKKLQEHGYNDNNTKSESPVKLANLLLGDIINGSLNSLDETMSREFDNSMQNAMDGD